MTDLHTDFIIVVIISILIMVTMYSLFLLLNSDLWSCFWECRNKIKKRREWNKLASKLGIYGHSSLEDWFKSKNYYNENSLKNFRTDIVELETKIYELRAQLSKPNEEKNKRGKQKR